MTKSGHDEGLLIWLLRHAKAAPDAPAGGTDHERPLAPRGRRDAAALGLRIRAGDLGFGDAASPGLVLASTATRATETAQRVADALGVPVDRRRRLYYGSPTDVLAELRTLDDDCRAVMVVGHNPTTHSLALELLDGDADGDGGGGVADRTSLSSYPTCGVTLFRTDATRWREVVLRRASLLGVAHPPYDV